MKVVQAIVKVMKAEGVDLLFAYPVDPLIEAAAVGREDRRLPHAAGTGRRRRLRRGARAFAESALLEFIIPKEIALSR